MINCYRYDIFNLADEGATTKLIVDGISNHCSRCSNFVPEISNEPCYFFDDGELTNPNKYLIRCVHYTACLEALNREATKTCGG